MFNKTSYLLIILFTGLFCFSHQLPDTEGTNLYTLTDDNFDAFIKNNDYVLVKFYAPWCGHCKKMAPDFASAAEELEYTGYKLAKLDATVHKNVAAEVGLSGYPTLKFYIKGEEKAYSGERTKDGIVEWVKNRVEKYEDQQNNRLDGEPEMDESVVILTEDNFDNYVKSHEFVFVKFYAPWCGHCKRMAPALAQAANELNEENHIGKIAKVDATIHKNLGARYGVRSYPTIKFFYKGNPIEYKGGREAKDFVEYIKKKSDNPLVDINTQEDLDQLKSKNDIAVVLFGGNEKELFTAFAVSYEHAVFGFCNNEELFKANKAKKGTVVLFKNFDERRNEIQGVYSLPTLKTFVENRSIPTLIEYEEKYKRFLFEMQKPGLVLFYDQEGPKADQHEDIMIDFSKRIKGRILVFKSGIKDEEQKKWAEELGVKEEMLPIVLILDTRANFDKYVMKNKKITPVGLRNFVNEWQNGNAEYFVKSDDVPEYQNGPVTVVVGKTFREIVLDETKDVLIEFYAPWCGHCQKLEPTYEELARTLSVNEKLVIAKMDATANEAEGISIQGFPTIKFFPANKKSSPVDFERSGDSDNIDKFVEFIKKHATHPVKSDLDLDEEEEEEKQDL